jgi:hypothetical protein
MNIAITEQVARKAERESCEYCVLAGTINEVLPPGFYASVGLNSACANAFAAIYDLEYHQQQAKFKLGNQLYQVAKDFDKCELDEFLVLHVGKSYELPAALATWIGRNTPEEYDV